MSAKGNFINLKIYCSFSSVVQKVMKIIHFMIPVWMKGSIF